MSFRLAKWLNRRGLRGGYRLMAIARRRGWLDRMAVFDINENVQMHVPIHRPDTAWDHRDLIAYDPPLIDDMVAAAGRMPQPQILVDCGADVGLVSVLVAAELPDLKAIYAFEPNPDAYAALAQNMEALPMPAYAFFAAVGAAAGRGRLSYPEHSASDHAQFVEITEDGSFEIRTVDSLDLPADAALILKIDVEGTEGDVIDGSMESLRRAPAFTVIFEAHLGQYRRTGEEPIDLVKKLNRVKPCAVHCCDLPDLKITLDRPFFDQVEDPEHVGYNILCRSLD